MRLNSFLIKVSSLHLPACVTAPGSSLPVLLNLFSPHITTKMTLPLRIQLINSKPVFSYCDDEGEGLVCRRTDWTAKKCYNFQVD